MAIKEVLATVTSKGQVTIPVEVQRRLGLKARDKLAFAIDTESDEVRVRPVRYSLKEVFGSVKPATSTEAFTAQSRQAWEEKVEEEVRKLTGE